MLSTKWQLTSRTQKDSHITFIRTHSYSYHTFYTASPKQLIFLVLCVLNIAVLTSQTKYICVLRFSFLFTLGAAIMRVGEWLSSMVGVCNEKVGAPYKKCRQIFNDAARECRDIFILNFFGLCKIAEWFGEVCHIVRGKVKALVTFCFYKQLGICLKSKKILL